MQWYLRLLLTTKCHILIDLNFILFMWTTLIWLSRKTDLNVWITISRNLRNKARKDTRIKFKKVIGCVHTIVRFWMLGTRQEKLKALYTTEMKFFGTCWRLYHRARSDVVNCWRAFNHKSSQKGLLDGESYSVYVSGQDTEKNSVVCPTWEKECESAEAEKVN